MRRVTDWVLAHRLVVVLLWLVVAGAGGATAGKTVGALTYDFGLPGQEAYEANTAIESTYGGGGLNDPIVLTVAGGGTDLRTDQAKSEFAQVARRIAAASPGTRVVTAADTDVDTLVAPDGGRAVALLYPTVVPGGDPYVSATPAIQAAAAKATAFGQPVEVTGTLLLADSGGGGRGVLFEIILGGAGALIVLVLVFSSLLAALPLLVAAVSILGTFLALLALTQVTDVSFVVQFLSGLIGLGVAIDYSLLIVMRWREERSHGADNDTAVRTAAATAGRSVIFSGTTVAVSLAALVLVPLPFLRSIGLGGLLIPIFSVLTSVTLVPVLLHVLGPKLEWPRRRATVADPTSRRWAAVARWVVRRKWVVIVGTSAVLLAMTAPLLTLHLGSPELDAYGTDSAPGRAAAAIVADGIPPGVLRPTEVLAPQAAADQVLGAVRAVPGVAGATAVDDPAWSRGGSRLLQVWISADPATEAGATTVDQIRAAATGAQVGGTPAEDADFVSAVYGDAPYVLLAIVLITFLLLARALRSVWLPVKALVLNVLSIGAAYGLTVLIWQKGLGTEAVFGADAAGAVTIWVPVAVFAFLFGLSMDYEVFILSRMRESYDEHGDTPRAVVDGISRTGRLVTSAALILFLAFVALSTVPSIDVKILATALALGIAVDALIVRALLAPALVAALGHVNWTFPAALAKVLRVDPNAPMHDAATPRVTPADDRATTAADQDAGPADGAPAEEPGPDADGGPGDEPGPDVDKAEAGAHRATD